MPPNAGALHLASMLMGAKDILFPVQSLIEYSTISRTITKETLDVRRPFLENLVTSVADQAPCMQYLVHYGPSGFDKSSVVEHALRNRAGVINIRCVAGPTPDSVLHTFSS